MTEKIYHLGIKALIRNSLGEILLLKVNQEKFKTPSPMEYWDIPGGRVMEGQTLEETLHREVKEETGLTSFDSYKPLDIVISNIEIPLNDKQKAGLVLSIYDCLIKEEVCIQLSEEHSDFSWASPQEAAHLLTHKYPPSFTEKVRDLAS